MTDFKWRGLQLRVDDEVAQAHFLPEAVRLFGVEGVAKIYVQIAGDDADGVYVTGVA